MSVELQTFLTVWDGEAKKTAAMLRALPADQYDFRPDPGARSLGELSWHLAEIEAYTTHAIDLGEFSFSNRPPGIERPRSVEALAPGYERVHAEAAERVRSWSPADLDRELRYFTGDELSIRQVLWSAMLYHLIHHRGQLSVLCRLAGGTSPGVFGPNREEMAAVRARAGS
jgi:uncharacterized damage-inducible protein DinB